MSQVRSWSAELDAVADLLREGGVLVLTGAGISTESGIPDYRGPGSPPRRPMEFREFAGGEEARQRYWARSFLGWPVTRLAKPNAGHRALALLEESGRIDGVITQNVDGLHQAAGSKAVLELHGSLAWVVCLDCALRLARSELQEELRALNPGFGAGGSRLNPDGDVELAPGAAAGFRVPPCPRCGGRLKPDVVFFGENVPGERVERAMRLLAAARALLVAGSSLTVFSGLRFVRKAASEAKPIVILNDGPTRGDGLAAIKSELRLGVALPALVERLGGDAAVGRRLEREGF